MNPTDRIRVVVAEDDDSLRGVIEEVIVHDGRFDVVAAVADTDAAIRAAEQTQAALALVDVSMPDGGGPRVARELQSRSPRTRVVALSSRDDRVAVVEMFRCGAVSYLVKGTATNTDIVATLAAAHRGQMMLPAKIGRLLLDEISEQLERAEADEEARRSARTRIGRVLTSGRVAMVLQPIRHLESGDVRGFEALARFDPPGAGPQRWFADAAAIGLGTELELLAVQSALAHLGRLPTDTTLSVNVSPATASDVAFHAMVMGALPRRLVMEITEHAPIDDYEAFQRSIEPLRAAGVRLAVDDAGAGFASLRHILGLAPDILKLDRSLTDGIDMDPRRRALARALIAFGQETETPIVAEGIETMSQQDELLRLGVRLGQGYLLGRPAPPTQIGEPCPRERMVTVDGPVTRHRGLRNLSPSSTSAWT